MIGVVALIIVLSIMNGFESEVRSRIIGFDAHIELRRFFSEPFDDYENIIRQIENIDHIVGISPYIKEKGLIIHKKNKEGVEVKGVDTQTIADVSDIQNDVTYGVFELGTVRLDSEKEYPGIVLGKYLADRLNADLGDRVQVLSPSGISPFMTQMPPLMTFQVTGFFETGIFEIDVITAYIDIRNAQRLFQLGNNVLGLELKLDDLYNADRVSEEVEKTLMHPYTTVTWFEMHKNLFAWMQMEKWGMFIILSLIIMVAAFNIVSTLIMVVLEKTKEIGVLKSMGATSKGITKIFMFEGLTAGIVGTVLGNIIGYGMCWSQLQYKWFSLPPDVYMISELPVLMQAQDFISISVASIVICFLATIYPALKAAKLNPVEAIRYE
jgi:lipoprotein-releasing system permease protein